MTRTRPPRTTGPAWRRAALTGAWLLLTAAPSLADAQSAPRSHDDGWRATRVAKWTLLATAVAFGVWSLGETRQADADFDALRVLCERDAASCAVAESGGYANVEAERLYDATRRHDRLARIGIFAGQSAALGSATFFIVDLRHGGSPDDIPYDPSRRAARGPTLRVGLRLTR
jgi:hypothetical protein